MRTPSFEFVLLLYVIVVVAAISAIVYIYCLERPLQTKKIVNEIIELKIDSCYSYSYNSKKHYEFFINSKYLAVVDSVRFVPFETKSKVNFYVKDVNSNYVINDWRRTYWKRDIDKLLLHFRNYLLTKK